MFGSLVTIGIGAMLWAVTSDQVIDLVDWEARYGDLRGTWRWWEERHKLWMFIETLVLAYLLSLVLWCSIWGSLIIKLCF